MMEAIHYRTRKFSTVCLGMQIACRVYSEMLEKIFVCKPSPVAWDGALGLGGAEGVLRGEGASDSGPCPHADRHTSQIQRCLSRRLYKEQKHHQGCPKLVWQDVQLRRVGVWGNGVLCERSIT